MSNTFRHVSGVILVCTLAVVLMCVNLHASTIQPGDILISNHSGQNVQLLNPGNGSVTTLVSVNTTPIGLAFDPSGNLYINAGNGIDKFDPTNNTLSSFFTGSGQREGLTFDPTTKDLFSVSYGGDSIDQVDLSGHLVRNIVIPGSSQVLGISARAGKLVVTDLGNGNVYLGTVTGNSFVSIGTVDPGNTYAPDIDKNGNIYVNDFGAGRVVKFTPGHGGYTESNFITGLNEPANGLAIGDDGSLTLSQYGANTVSIYNSDGTLRRNFPGVQSPDELTVFAPIRTGGDTPEPATGLLLGAGIVMVGIVRHFFNRQMQG